MSKDAPDYARMFCQACNAPPDTIGHKHTCKQNVESHAPAYTLGTTRWENLPPPREPLRAQQIYQTQPLWDLINDYVMASCKVLLKGDTCVESEDAEFSKAVAAIEQWMMEYTAEYFISGTEDARRTCEAYQVRDKAVLALGKIMKK